MEQTFIIAGRLSRDYLLPRAGSPHIDVPGGNLLYTAAGLAVWDNEIGLLGRVGSNYPKEWLGAFEKRGWDTRGIHILEQALDLRHFQAQVDLRTIQHSNPLAHFARLGLPFPKSLLGYQPPDLNADRRTLDPASPRSNEIPEEYLDSRALHVCPLDYTSAERLLLTFWQAKVPTLTLDPSAAYMNSTAYPDLRPLLNGLTAFLPSEEELRSLFWGKTNDLWEMAEDLGGLGCEFIVVKRGVRGQLLYDSISKKRWEIPAYPARLVDPTGAGNAFCGGFLAGYLQDYDPLQGVLHGNVSASLTIEGSGIFQVLEILPGLAQARLESLGGIVRKI